MALGSPRIPAPLTLCACTGRGPRCTGSLQSCHSRGEALLLPTCRGAKGPGRWPCQPRGGHPHPVCRQGSPGSGGTGPSAGAGGERTCSSAAKACPEAGTAGAWSSPAETGPTPAGSEPIRGCGDAVHPQPSPGSHAARRCSRSSPAGGAGLSTQLSTQHTAVFAPVGYVKHSTFSPVAPQAAHPTGKPPAHPNEQTEHSLPQNSRGVRLGGACHYSSGINEEEPEEHIYWEICQSFPPENTLCHLHHTGISQAPPPIRKHIHQRGVRAELLGGKSPSLSSPLLRCDCKAVNHVSSLALLGEHPPWHGCS